MGVVREVNIKVLDRGVIVQSTGGGRAWEVTQLFADDAALDRFK